MIQRGTFAPEDSRRAVSLLEILVATVAGTVVLGGFAAMYMITMQSYDTSSRVSHLISYSGMLDDTLIFISMAGPADDRKVFEGPDDPRDDTKTYVALAYDVLCNHQPNCDYFYPRIDNPPEPPSPRQAPNCSSPNREIATFDRDTGLVYWYKAQWSEGHSRYLESHVYHIRVSPNELQTVYGQSRDSFADLSNGEIQAFIQTDTYRKASRLLAKDVLTFSVGLDAGSGAIDWVVDYHRGD